METRPTTIIYDIDDVLWGLNRRVSERLGFNYDDITDFDYKYTDLDAELIKKIYQAYNDRETFRDMGFYDGVEDLLEVEKLGATVLINSCACSEEVVEQKYYEIQKILPKVNLKHVEIYSPDSKDRHVKTIGPDVLVFVDDNPHNVAKSQAKYTIVPRKPWNSSERAKNIMARSASELIFIDNFAETLAKVTEIVRRELQ